MRNQVYSYTIPIGIKGQKYITHYYIRELKYIYIYICIFNHLCQTYWLPLYASTNPINKYNNNNNNNNNNNKGKLVYSKVSKECKQSVFFKQGILVTWSCDWKESRANCQANLEVLSCSTLAGMTLQLPCMLHTCATFCDSPVARSNREALLECILLSFSLHSLTHYPYMIPT